MIIITIKLGLPFQHIHLIQLIIFKKYVKFNLSRQHIMSKQPYMWDKFIAFKSFFYLTKHLKNVVLMV